MPFRDVIFDIFSYDVNGAKARKVWPNRRWRSVVQSKDACCIVIMTFHLQLYTRGRSTDLVVAA